MYLAFSLTNEKNTQQHFFWWQGGVVSYYVVLGASACRKGDPKTFVLGKGHCENAWLLHFLNVLKYRCVPKIGFRCKNENDQKTIGK